MTEPTHTNDKGISVVEVVVKGVDVEIVVGAVEATTKVEVTIVTNMEGRNKQLISMNMKVYNRIVNQHLTLVMYLPPIHLFPTPYT